MVATKTRHAADSAAWMSVGEAARACGISEETVRRRIRNGTIPVRALCIDTTMRIDREAWDAWFQSALLNSNIP